MLSGTDVQLLASNICSQKNKDGYRISKTSIFWGLGLGGWVTKLFVHIQPNLQIGTTHFDLSMIHMD